MPKIKHTATGPNGEVFKRTSASRTYSHITVGRESVDYARDAACRQHKNDVENFEQHQVWARDGYEPSAWMNKPSHGDPSKTIAEEFREEGKQSAIKWLADKPSTAKAWADQELVRRLDEIARKEAEGHYSRFTVDFGWSSRLDLAQKNASSSRASRYAEVIILEAVIG
jgi:hypothetical protein